jgi:lipoprotein-anchoring transpeptidase ErfK/SrfK
VVNLNGPGVPGDGGNLKALRRALAAGVAFVALAAPADAATRRARQEPAGQISSGQIPGQVSARPAAAKQSHAKRASAKRSTKAAQKQAPKAPFGEMPKGPLQLVVSIANQHVTLYSNGARVAQGPVSTGVPGHSTPMGVFSVIQKDRYHHSNLYSNAPMPYMERITWSGVALHEGPLPGHPASHGCIRLSHDFASRLWQVTKLGVRVIVSRSDVSPYEFNHPLLFNPKQKPETLEPAAELPFDGLRPSFSELGDHYRAPVRLAWAASVKSDAKIIEIPRQPDEPAASAPVEAAPAPPSPPAPAAAATAAPAAPPAEVETTATVKAPDAPKPAEAPLAAPAEAPAAAPAQAAEAAPAAPAVADPAKPEAEPVGLPKPAPLKKNTEPQKRSGHVAVFVSRKEKKIFVRQGFVPLFDMPVEIDNVDQPLGTHVFTAMELKDDGTRMRWNAITMPGGGEPARTERRTKKGHKPEPVKPAVEARHVPTAAQALDRIHIPQEAIDRISELLTTGSSLTVSDAGLGSETGRYTDFIVLTR